MISVNPELKVGQNIKTGDYIGVPYPEAAPATGQGIHWQFGFIINEKIERIPPCVL